MSGRGICRGHGRWPLLAVVSLLIAGSMSTAHAQTWDGSASTDWFDGDNWVGNTVPDGTPVDVVVDSTSPNAPTVDDQSTNGAAEAYKLKVGNSGTGALTVEDGGLLDVTHSAWIGYVFGSNGTVTVKGVHTGGSQDYRSTLSVGGSSGNFLLVGLEGTGALTVEDGGLVDVSDSVWIGSVFGSNGTVTVKGVHTGGSQDYRSTLSVGGTGWSYLAVGDEDTGALTVEDGGLVDVTSDLVIGHVSGSNGIATVKGVHTGGSQDYRSTLSGNELMVGKSGTGALTVEDGGLVDVTSDSFIGSASGSNGIATVKGVHTGGSQDYRSTLSGNELRVGDNGTGALTVEDGGLVDVDETFVIGSASGSNGIATVKGVHTGGSQDYRSTLSVGGAFVGFLGTGALTVEDGGLVDVTGDAFIGLRSGSDGTVNIGAAAGSTALAPGFFNARSVYFGDGAGTLVFNHTDVTGTYQFAPDIVSFGGGTHAILHEAGWTGLTGDGSGFDGQTSIDGGILSVSGSLGGVVNINSGGTLAGTGMLSGIVNVNSGGTISPGNSIGTINVSDIVFDASSTYQVEIDVAGNSDLINASRAAEFNGGTVAVTGTALYNTPYTIVTAERGIQGEFAALTGLSNTLFVTNSLSYDANNVYLSSVLVAAFCDFATTANQSAVACDGLDSLSPYDDLAQAILALTTAANVQAAYDALSGQIHPSLKGALLDNSQHKVNAVNKRIHAAFLNGDTQTSTAAFGNLSSLADGDNGFWITGYGSWSDSDATGNTAQMDNDLGGVVFGIDRQAGEMWRFGVLGGYSRTDVTQTALLSAGSADTWSLGLYGGAEAGASKLSFGGIYNWHSVDTARTVSFPGFSEYLVAGYDAQSWQLFAEAGHELQVHTNLMLEPFAGISHISLDTDGYSETGGSAALTASADSQSTTFTTLGVRSSLQVMDRIHARGMIGWRHAFGDTDPTSVFMISGSNPFTITGAPVAQDVLVTELGMEAGLSDTAFIGAAYNGQYGSGTIEHGFNASFRAKF
ncbi:MAG: autotransporter domain-containing protein [Hyphomicrobiales bacterium]|nr:autotransporter domain-containing protein [Hyphomicrobiales bacterium]MCP4997369.1 autotransporter domain-containing protein [Hyphomicrobiales bacterium]